MNVFSDTDICYYKHCFKKLPMYILNNILGQISEFVSELCNFQLE